MVRTQIQLSEEDYEKLRRVAARERRSIADCIREGIRWFLQRAASKGDELASIAGTSLPLDADDVKLHDRWHADAIAESKRRGRP